MLTIDGSYGEGGGQILRSALTLAMIMGRTMELQNIRAKRANPGLRPQHLACVRAAAAICDGEVSGAVLGSHHLRFSPAPVRPGDYRFDIGTAGSVALVLQTILLPLGLAGGVSRVTVTGGTHVPMSPCFHYLDLVLRPVLVSMGLVVSLHLKEWGWYPKGGGKVEARIDPTMGLGPFVGIRPTGAASIRALSASSGLPAHVRRRQGTRLSELLAARGLPVDLAEEEAPALSPGSLVFLWTVDEGRRAGSTALGARGKPAEQVADEAVRGLTAFLQSGAAVDDRLADQLVLPAVVARGVSRWYVPRVSRHLRTNAWVARQFGLERVSLPLEVQCPGEVTIEGAGLGVDRT